MIALLLGVLMVQAPVANAAEPAARHVTAAAVSSAPDITFGTSTPGTYPAGTVSPMGIPWDKVVKTFGNLVACNAARPGLMILYFPAIVVCLPNPSNGTAVAVIFEP
ncbi:hypothetical protein [Cellulomonas sp. NS3]|uniref:hypothetical protein n=1 Tax=Cellulomonas sp. NS3 TaxID=2973977 RepID=UPI0021614CA9|nr:hypothetical protein [Cellulomonas sp. NS3]